jgi:selenocysteine lyase/cysteine desulfurase
MFEGQEKIREREFPQLKKRIWLNSAATVPLPKSTIKAMHTAIDTHTNWPLLPPEKVEQFFTDLNSKTREGLAELLDCNPEDFAFVNNTAHGLNFPLHGIDWEKGDNIVTSELEFPTNYLPWQYISKRKGVELRTAKINDRIQISTDEVIELIDDRTKLVSLSLVQFSNGQRIDAQKIASVAHKHNAFLALDSIQGCGGLEVYPTQMSVDFLSAGGPKYLMSPMGLGICYISPKVVERMDPPLQGAGNYNFDDHDWMNRNKPYHVGAARFQFGTHAIYCLAGLQASVALINSIGIKTIAAHNKLLTEMLIEGFEEMGAQIITPRDFTQRGAMVNVRFFEEIDLDKLVNSLIKNHGIFVSNRFNGLRVSTHLYNTEQEIETFFAALKTIL